jgi:hypothetical protein
MMAVLATSSAATGTCRYPLQRSSLLKSLQPSRRAAKSTIFGKGYLSSTVCRYSGGGGRRQDSHHHGLFEFTRMPLGLRNAGMTFQRLMDSMLGSLLFAFVYLDDILVASPDPSSHRRHLEAVFTVLQGNGLVVNPDKCLFGCTEVEFLGHRLTAGGISPLPSRVQAIADFPPPPTVKQLQAFLCLFNFYRRFIPAAARIVSPLTRASVATLGFLLCTAGQRPG